MPACGGASGCSSRPCWLPNRTRGTGSCRSSNSRVGPRITSSATSATRGRSRGVATAATCWRCARPSRTACRAQTTRPTSSSSTRHRAIASSGSSSHAAGIRSRARCSTGTRPPTVAVLLQRPRPANAARSFAVLYDLATRTRVREYRFDDTPVGNSGVAQRGGRFLAINYGGLHACGGHRLPGRARLHRPGCCTRPTTAFTS